MKLFSMALKFNSLFAGKITCQSSLIAGDQIQSGFDSSTIGLDFAGLLFSKIGEFLMNFIYVICTFVLNFIELVQLAITKILGVGGDIKDYVVIDQTNPLVKILLDETVLTVFKTCCGLAIVFIIVFTIISIIKSEYAFAVEQSDTNGKGRILSRSLRSIFTLTIFPLVLIFVIVLTNAILAGFNDILRGDGSSSIAAQIYMTSAYNANNFRNYADDDQRIPICINFDDPATNGLISGYSSEELVKIYNSFQDKGREIYNSVADRSFGSFSDTISYQNNHIYNKSTYSGYEKFACTREQYYVLADFVDYAVKNGISYYVKNIKDVDIDWKYVDKAIFDKDSYSLTITYRDASNLTNKKSYSVVYTPSSENISTPISDALKTISALLSFDDYADNTFNVLKRVEDSINVVEWETDKVLIRFSDEFAEKIKSGYEDINDLKSAMTTTDLLILYEQSRFEYNNTINATIEEIAEKGFEIPVKKVTKRSYQSITHTYITTSTLYAVTINGRNYEVELNDELKDENGSFILDSFKDPYYTLLDSSFGLDEVYEGGGGYWSANSSHVDDEKVLEIKVNGVSLGKYTFGTDSYKDILVYIETGTKEIKDNVSGLVSYVSYDDQVEQVIKQDSFPNKLFNDLQVIYKDININNLVSSGTWLEQLSEYVSGTSNSNTSNIQTGLIHPLGLIMSEMFLGDVSTSEKVLSMGEIEFGTKFDSDTIKALILSLLGEDRYFQTKEQLNYFVEIFNAFMAPVLDEIAYFENFDLMDGNSESVQLYTYRAYLASVLLTSNSAEWFYNTALSYFGATKFKEEAINSDGYLKIFNELSSTYQSYVRNLYSSAKKQLEDQFVLETDKAYPEYMKALKNYIDGTETEDDYFGGRLELILKSILSDSKKGENVDVEKKKIKDAYTKLSELKDQVCSVLNVISSWSFELMFNSFFDNPSSSFSLKINDFDESMGGEKTKDAFDDLTTVDELTSKQDELLTLASTAKDEDTGEYTNQESFFYFLMNSSYIPDNLKSDFEKYAKAYYDAVNEYLSQKIKYYDVDNSSSNVGKHDEIQAKIEKAFKGAGELYDDALSVINSVPDVNSEYLVKKDSKKENFMSEDTWNNLKANYNKLNQKVTELNKKEELEKKEQQFISYVEYLGSYIRNQEELDKLNRYEILYACDSQSQSTATQTLDIVVSSKHYEVGQNFTKGKFIEYVLGYQNCVDLGYTPVFVSEGYDGIVSFKDVSDAEIKEDCLKNLGYVSKYTATEEQKANWDLYNTDMKWDLSAGYYSQNPEVYVSSKYYLIDGKYKKIDKCFNDVYDFAVQIGEISSRLYQMSNLSNLSAGAIDEITIERDSEANPEEKDLAYQFLDFILDNEYLPEDLVSAFFGVTATKDDSGKIISSIKTNAKGDLGDFDDEKKNSVLNTVLGYLLVTETDKTKKDFVDYSKMTLKEIRIKCLEALIDFEQQGGETVEQNQKRYLTLLAIGCSDWERTSDGTVNGTILGGAINNNWSKDKRGNIVRLKVNNQSQGVILHLAGLENRPYEELIDAEYSIDFNLLGEDEQNGDIFVICIFDKETKKYFPFLMTNKSNPDYDQLRKDEEGKVFFQHFNLNKAHTTYYMAGEENTDTVAFPIIARGIVDTDGMPTAIRKVDGNIEYYRNDIVIRDASDIGLEQYYLSVDQVSVNYTGLSSIVNGISKLFTGKTLVEHLSSSVPRFAAHTDYNFCYGVTSQVTARSNGDLIAMSYNFGRGNNLEMDCFFDIEKIDVLVLAIGTFSIVVALVKALFACIGRVFDITIDFLLAPLVISTISLKSDSKDKSGSMAESSTAYDTWKENLKKHILSVFSLVVGFNIFFILAPLVMEAELFNEVSIKAFENLPLFRLATVEFVNQIARLLLLIGLASMTKRAPHLFSKILSVDDAFAKGSGKIDDIKKTKNAVMNTWTGKDLAVDVKFLKDSAVKMIPGKAIVDRTKQSVKNVSSWTTGKAVKLSARMHGVPKEQAEILEASVRKVLREDPTSPEVLARANRRNSAQRAERARVKNARTKAPKKNKGKKSKRTRGGSTT